VGGWEEREDGTVFNRRMGGRKREATPRAAFTYSTRVMMWIDEGPL
jgi:hypothetical protein